MYSNQTGGLGRRDVSLSGTSHSKEEFKHRRNLDDGYSDVIRPQNLKDCQAFTKKLSWVIPKAWRMARIVFIPKILVQLPPEGSIRISREGVVWIRSSESVSGKSRGVQQTDFGRSTHFTTYVLLVITCNYLVHTSKLV